ncbi:ABC transporter transmembrane domain-containing protein [Albibacillus kandeliae]|uniref:ABC transporter transmembrane domain-containing protein n=1 Tax=Albibacillus kandeliae TaxID=2174228 RepID=UPI001E486263|nr:ABC transporter ATP-binding protein [Albibacillus kandeliae]
MTFKFPMAPHRVRKTGDDSAAASLMGYVWRMSGWHNVWVCVCAVLIALVNLVPLELQRRIVNEVVGSGEMPMLLWFGGAYVAVVALHQGGKLALRLYQGWLSESAILYTRRHLLRLYGESLTPEENGQGRTVSIVGTEVEILGGFVGESISQAFANVAMLLGITGYMLIVEPRIAVFALFFLLPQVLLTPLLQRRLNRLIEKRVTLVRELGDEISLMGSEEAGEGPDAAQELLPKIYRNRMRYLLLKYGLKALLNLLSASGPASVLLVGGYLVMQGETQVGVIVAFISGFERMADPLRELIGFYRQAAQASVQHRLIASWMAER